MPFAEAEVFMVEIAHFYRHKFRLGELQVPAVSEVFTPLISARRGTTCSKAFFLTISSEGGGARKKDERTEGPDRHASFYALYRHRFTWADAR